MLFSNDLLTTGLPASRPSNTASLSLWQEFDGQNLFPFYLEVDPAISIHSQVMFGNFFQCYYAHFVPFAASVLRQGEIILSSFHGGLCSQWAGATGVESDAGGDGLTGRIEQSDYPAFAVFATFDSTEVKSLGPYLQE